MTRKFKPGNYVMLKNGGIPMMVTMYAGKHTEKDPPICVTWTTLDNKTKTAKFQEEELVLCTLKEWNGKPLGAEQDSAMDNK